MVQPSKEEVRRYSPTIYNDDSAFVSTLGQHDELVVMAGDFGSLQAPTTAWPSGSLISERYDVDVPEDQPDKRHNLLFRGECRRLGWQRECQFLRGQRCASFVSERREPTCRDRLPAA